jgi:hypothetical protein
MIIKISDSEYNKCLRFSKKVVDTNIDCYARRNQTDKEKIIDDILVGKIAEIASEKLLTARGIEHSETDLNVYSVGGKSFDPDLYGWTEWRSWKFHVKCMKHENAERWGLSWSFQATDHLVTDPNSDEYIILCELMDYHTIDIKTVVRANTLFNCWGDPKLNKLKGIKKVLYWDTLDKLPGIKKM